MQLHRRVVAPDCSKKPQRVRRRPVLRVTARAAPTGPRASATPGGRRYARRARRRAAGGAVRHAWYPRPRDPGVPVRRRWTGTDCERADWWRPRRTTGRRPHRVPVRRRVDGQPVPHQCAASTRARSSMARHVCVGVFRANLAGTSPGVLARRAARDGRRRRCRVRATPVHPDVLATPCACPTRRPCWPSSATPSGAAGPRPACRAALWSWFTSTPPPCWPPASPSSCHVGRTTPWKRLV